jgi:hypothetical protein
MNLYIVDHVFKTMKLILVTLLSMMPNYSLKMVNYEVSHQLTQTNTNIEEQIVIYEIENIYTNKRPSGYKNLLRVGENGSVFYDIKTREEVFRKNPVSARYEVGTGKSGDYSGKITGYSPYCLGCSKTGTVACYTKNKQRHSLISDGLYYKDEEYGDLRIVAAAVANFPCGTVIKISPKGKKSFDAVVLDRGGAMNSAWRKGRVLIDVAFDTDKEARTVTNSSTNFEVQRWGW